MDAEIVLVRHAESEWNARGLWQGQANPPLSERGRAHAREVAEELAPLAPRSLYASDLARARETAEILGARLGLSPVLDARLREHHVGSWSGLTREEIAERWPDHYTRLRDRDPEVRPPGGESLRELEKRVHAVFDEIAARHAGERVLVVSHAGVVRTLVPGARLDPLGILRIRR